MPREIRIFLSTPSDIVEERRALAALVAEINDVVAFLAPERDVHLKLLSYETDAYPDVGGAQNVIDGQISVDDYDIYLGIMWKRAGTPTKPGRDDSGTIHEFERALEHRKKTGKPTIMFYFCLEEIPLPTTQEELDQLSRVIKFRDTFKTIALAADYPKRVEFRERARLGLLKAIADILRNEPSQRAAFAAEPAAIPEQLERLCNDYDRVRGVMQFGSARTQRMTAIVEDMKVQAPAARGVLQQLKDHASPGHRLAAIVILQAFPSRDELGWLADRLDPAAEKSFIGFQAAAALLQAVRSLPRADCSEMQKQLRRARDLAARDPNDPPRIVTLDNAIRELELKCGQPQA